MAFVLVPLTGVYGIRGQVRWALLSTVPDRVPSSMLRVVIAAGLRMAFWLVEESRDLVRRRNGVIEQVADEEEPSHVQH